MKTTILNFSFQVAGHGHYKVTYTSNSGKSFTRTISDMQLIDVTKNSDSPKLKDLNELKRVCKN